MQLAACSSQRDSHKYRMLRIQTQFGDTDGFVLIPCARVADQAQDSSVAVFCSKGYVHSNKGFEASAPPCAARTAHVAIRSRQYADSTI